MAAFDQDTQRLTKLHNLLKESGGGVAIASVSGQTFTVATKLKRVRSGMGVMDTDGMIARATPGIVSDGQVQFTRYAPIETSADTISYELLGW